MKIIEKGTFWDVLKFWRDSLCNISLVRIAFLVLYFAISSNLEMIFPFSLRRVILVNEAVFTINNIAVSSI